MACGMTGHMCSDGSAAGAWIKMMMMMIYDLSGLDTVICQHIEMAKAAATGQNLRLVYTVQGDTLRQCKNYAFRSALIIQAERRAVNR